MIEWLLDNPETGWVAVLIYLAWEIRGPKGKVNSIKNDIKSVTVVVRALARSNENIDSEQVDEYLVEENGSEPSDFIDFGKLKESDGIIETESDEEEPDLQR